MRRRQRLIAVGVAALTAGCASIVTIVPPRVPVGGRTLSIAVTSTDPKRMVVATETGGLFRSFDGGKSWQHLDNLPIYQTRDVAFASLDPNVIVATAGAQYRAVNDGGIWRSRDGGATWSQPPGWAPAPGPDCPSRPGAFGISHMPLSRTFFVGTDCGIAVSNDNGATWSHFVLDPTAVGSDSLQHRVRSLLVINRTAGVAAADRGLFFLAPNGVWTKAADVDTSGQVPVLHAFDAPFLAGISNVFFHASGGQKLWLSTDSGATWSQVPAPSNNNREAFVRVARSVSGDDSRFDVYFGDGINLNRQSFSLSGLQGSGWTQLASDHTDPSDVGFGLERRIPLLLATDGGAHLTTDQGASWKLTGGGFGGLTALQISDITGQSVSGSQPHLDLYFATQDNDLWASPDGGHSWPGDIAGDGRFLAVDPTSVDHQGSSGVTGLVTSIPSTFITDAHFANQRGFPNAPAGDTAAAAEAPSHIIGDAYVQFATNTGTSPPTFDAFLTLSAGSAWSKSFTLPLAPVGPAIFAGFLANPTAYQGVQRPGALPNGGPRFGLFRASNLAGQAVVTAVDSAGIGAFGSLHTPVSRRVVVGADPRDANHLLAADVENGGMKFSADGGGTWFPLPQLTQAVTGSGSFIFTVGELSLATVIAWDPFDSCHILVGTTQNGVIRSTDGGNSWSQIQGSPIVTYVSSFYFPPTGAVWVSTNGRGLWNLDLSRPAGADFGRCRFPQPPVGGLPGGGVISIDPSTGASAPFSGPGDPSVCPGCTVVVVRNGWVTGVQLAYDSVREVAISSGTISTVDRAGREVPMETPNTYRPGDGPLDLGKSARAALGSRRVRGLVLEGGRLRRWIASRDELPFAPARTPLVFAFRAAGARRPPVAKVIGTDFVPASRGGLPVRILLDQEVVARDVQVDANGSFSADVPVRQLPGEVLVTVVQQDGHRLTQERTILEVTREAGR